MPMRTHRLFVLAAVLGIGALLVAPAWAHNRVKSTSPKKNGTASTSIRTVTVTFDKPIRRGTLQVTGPGNRRVSGSGGRDPRRINRLLTELNRGLRSGSYRARYTIVAADGHRQRGSFRFRLRR
jgi:methionine-rich copper-binding protein CopC